MSTNPVLDTIHTRRSIRVYTDDDLCDGVVRDVLDAGRWAPSGLNNQPWRFAVIRDSVIRERLAGLTHYGAIIRRSNVCVAVFYNTESGYNRDKDMMGIGACIQNMLLAAHSLGIGAVWLWQILEKKDDVNRLLEIDAGNELAAVIALGRPDESPRAERISLEDLILKSI